MYAKSLISSDTLFVVFNSAITNQKYYERKEFCKQIGSSEKIVYLKQNVCRLEQSRKVVNDRIIDTIGFAYYTVLDTVLFKHVLDTEIKNEKNKLEQELSMIEDGNSDEAQPIIASLKLVKLHFNYADTIVIPPELINVKERNFVFLQDIDTDEKFFEFEDKLKGRRIYLVNVSNRPNESIIAYPAIYMKMSPERVNH